jgi:hypothetical protein
MTRPDLDVVPIAGHSRSANFFQQLLSQHTELLDQMSDVNCGIRSTLLIFGVSKCGPRR